MPVGERSAFTSVLRRVGFAAGLLLFVAAVVWFGRGGYIDGTGGQIGVLDAIYYASVTVTTTGYGDITAVTDGARLATILLITPARIMFLILVVSTTVEVLTEQSRQALLSRRWRQRVKDHYVICGFGATGISAARDLIGRGIHANNIVAVDMHPEALDDARRLGLVAIDGDASRSEVLHAASVARAKAVIVAPNRDDTAVLITLTAREISPDVHIVAGGREQENLHLLRQGGANEVIDATAAVGRMLGLGTTDPAAITVLDDLLDGGDGLQLSEVAPVTVDGKAAVPDGATLVAVIRDGQRLRLREVDPNEVVSGDRLVVLNEISAP